MLVAILDPAHRSDNPAGQERNQEILGIDVALDAETAAHIWRRNTHAALRQSEYGRRLSAEPMHHLGRGPNRDGICALVVDADNAAAFQWHAAVAVMIEPAFQLVWRARQRSVDVTLRDREFADDIGANLLVD